MALKLLAVGDLHLGRLPSRLPETLQDRARDLGPARAWRRVVDAAIAEGVHAIALAGDVVEDEHDFLGAYRFGGQESSQSEPFRQLLVHFQTHALMNDTIEYCV